MSAPGRLDISVLGPISARDASGRDVTPSGALQRRLLALLVLRRGTVVTTDAAIDALWPNSPPRDATAALQNHMSRLRRALSADVIQSIGAGYLLDASAVDVDIDRVEALLAPAADGHAGIDELAGLVARWQGEAFPELEDTAAGHASAARHDELRTRAREALAARRLALGDADGVIVDLGVLVDDEPLRERPRELLMQALAASGRSAEALRVYDDFRRTLGAELGIEPSPALAAQHGELLAGSYGSPSGLVSRLPSPTTRLLGRDELLDEVCALTEAARTVTLVGPGGVGKTRLLVALGHRLVNERPERAVVLCELTQAAEGTVGDVVTAALGIDGRPGVMPIDRVVGVVHDTAIVILLDNCEHVLDQAAEVAERLVAGCPNAHVVATSRERLRVAGEHVRVVPPLASEGQAAPAVDLFVERATAVRPAFASDDAARPLVAEIVRRLDGLPLAIELAAARMHALELDEVAAGLDRPLALLSGGSRTSSRHSSLTAVVSWSYGFLDAELQSVFDALSVFSRSFTVTDAAAVCGLDEERTADALGQLVERSLAVRTPARRYALLETLRAFGADRLATSGRQQRVSERHARWMVEWAERADRRLHAAGEPTIVEVDDAVPELRAALGWLLDNRLTASAGRLLAALVNWSLLRLRPDVMAWAERVIAADPDDRSPVASQVWTAAAYHAWMAGDMAAAAQRSERAIRLAEAEPAGPTQTVLTMRGNVDLFAGRLDAAAAWYERAITAAGDDPGQRLIAGGALLLALGYAGDPRAAPLSEELLDVTGAVETAPAAYFWHCAGEAVMTSAPDVAKQRFATAVQLATATHASFVRGFAGASLASMEARDGDPQAAAAEYGWLIPHWVRSGMRSTQWTVLRSVVGLLERLDRRREAAVLEGAVRSAADGARIFGADEVALRDVGERLRAELGDEAYAAARSEGARLDAAAAADFALRSLR